MEGGITKVLQNPYYQHITLHSSITHNPRIYILTTLKHEVLVLQWTET